MISTTFGWRLPRSHSGIAPDNTIFISRTTNRFKFSPLESIIKQRRSVTEDPRHFRKARHIPNLEQMTIEVALGRVELKRKSQPSGPIFLPDLLLLHFFFSMILASCERSEHMKLIVWREKNVYFLLSLPPPPPPKKENLFECSSPRNA